MPRLVSVAKCEPSWLAVVLWIASAVATAVVPIDAARGVGLTYFDADNGENFAPNLSPSSAIAVTPVANDNLWGFVSDNGAAAPNGVFQSVFEAGGGNTAEDVPEITQTITGLTPNTAYDVYVAYWQGAQADVNWNVRAGFSSGNLTLFNAHGPNASFPTAVAGTNALYHNWDQFAPPTNPANLKALFVEEGRTLLLGSLGPTTSSASGAIDVFINDLPTTMGGPDAAPNSARTWFDGVAYVPAGTDVFLAPGDFNDDDALDPADAHIFLANLHTDVTDFSALDTYRLGDLNADLLINHADFVAFKDRYNGPTAGSPDGDLTLQVVTAGPNAGAVHLLNDSGLMLDIDYYEIASSTGALNPAGWISFDDAENDDLETMGWDEAPASDANLLSEINLQSMATMTPGATLSLGQAFNAAGTQDLEFFFGLTDGSLARGIVQYIGGSLSGDYNRNNVVDAADYVVWRNTLNQSVPSGSGADGDGNGVVEQADYNLWRANFGKALSTANALSTRATLPEPTCFGLIISALLALAGGRRWRIAESIRAE